MLTAGQGDVRGEREEREREDRKGNTQTEMVVMETIPRGFLNSKLDWLGQS